MSWTPVLTDAFDFSEPTDPVWTAVVTDDFTSSGGGVLDPTKWAVANVNGGSALVDTGALRLVVPSAPGPPNPQTTVVADVSVQDVRLDYDAVVSTTGVLFHNGAIRYDAGADNAYRVQISRNPAAGDLEGRLFRTVGGVNTQIGVTVLALGDVITRWRVRIQAIGDQIKVAVRDFSLGPIAEGSWDIEETDANITAAGACFVRLTGGNAAEAQQIDVDGVTISENQVGTPADWSAVVTDDFTGVDGADPNPANWAVVESGAATATIQTNALALTAGGSDTAGSSATINSTPGTGDLVDTRVELDVNIPTTGRFFSNVRLRVQNSGQDYYRLFIRRSPDLPGSLGAYISKTTAAGGNQDLTAELPLDDAVQHWNCRVQVMENGGNTELKMAIRPFSAGAIPEGTWDRQVTDSTSPIIGAGEVEIEALSAKTDASITLTLDNVVISDFVSGGGSAFVPIFTDSFDAGAGNEPDPNIWDVETVGTASAVLADSKLRMSGSGTADVKLDSAPGTGDLLDARLDFDVTIPPSGVFFHNGAVRVDEAANTYYRVGISRPATNGPITARLFKTINGVHTNLAGDLDLPAATGRWNVRIAVFGTQVKAAVRDFALGAIPEDAWDFEAVDSQIAAPGPVFLRLNTQAEAIVLDVDNVVISVLDTPVSNNWDPTKWDTYTQVTGNASASAELVDNQGRFTVSGGSDANNTSVMNAVAKLPGVTEPALRIDYEYEPPVTGPDGRFFATTAMRVVPHTVAQTPDYDAYRLFVRRTPNFDDAEAVIVKEVGGVLTELSPVLPMPNGVTRWSIRCEIIDEGGIPTIRAAVRDAALGSIPEGDWDLVVADTGPAPLTADGTIRFLLSRGTGTGSGTGTRFSVFDNVTISTFVNDDLPTAVIDLSPAQIDSIAATLIEPLTTLVFDVSPPQEDSVISITVAIRLRAIGRSLGRAILRVINPPTTEAQEPTPPAPPVQVPATVSITSLPATMTVGDQATVTFALLDEDNDTVTTVPSEWFVQATGGLVLESQSQLTATVRAANAAAGVVLVRHVPTGISAEVTTQVVAEEPEPAVPTSVTITPLPVSMLLDETASVTGSLRDQNGAEITTTGIDWQVQIQGGLVFSSFDPPLTNTVRAANVGSGSVRYTHVPSGLTAAVETLVKSEEQTPSVPIPQLVFQSTVIAGQAYDLRPRTIDSNTGLVIENYIAANWDITVVEGDATITGVDSDVLTVGTDLGDTIRISALYTADTLVPPAAEVTTTIVAPPSGSYPNNEPADFDPLVLVDGSTTTWPGFTNSGADWNDPSRISTVVDETSKYGFVTRKKFFVGDESGWHGFNAYNNPSRFDEVYTRLVFTLSDNWDYHSGGDKLYLHNTGAVGQDFYIRNGVFYTEFNIVGKPLVARQVRLIIPGSPPVTSVTGFGGGPFALATRGQEHTIEIIRRINSAIGVADGSARVWVDDIEYTRFSAHGGGPAWLDFEMIAVEWLTESGGPAGPSEGIRVRTEAPLFWGGQGDTKTVDDHINISELYISARNL